MNALILILAALLQTSPEKADSTRASIEGTVILEGSGEPLAGIRVTLTRQQDKAAQPDPATLRAKPPAPAPATATDAQGRFQLRDLEPGSYKVSFAGNGYVRQEYGQKIFPGEGLPLALAAGATLKNIDARIQATSAVTGIIRNGDKEPIAALPVHLLRFAYDANGQRALQPVISTVTDDRGDYRFYFITPGRYFLAAGALRQSAPPRNVNGAMESYPLTYYPGFSDIGQAGAIDARPGSEARGDLVVARQSLRRVRGRIVDGRISTPPSSVRIGVLYRGASGADAWEALGRSFSYNSGDGTYELRDMAPGSYLLAATWGDNLMLSNSALSALGGVPATPGATPTPEERRAQSDSTSNVINLLQSGVAWATVNIGDTDIDNLPLEIRPGVNVSGLVRIEAPGSPDGLKTLKPQLKPSVDGRPVSIPNVYASTARQTNPDGTFNLLPVRPGEYRLAIDGLASGLYVKEARYGSNDALNSPLKLGEGPVTLEIVLSPGAATVEGAVTSASLDPAPGAQVVLVPDRTRDRLDLYKVAKADAAGRFSFSSVTPGDYKLFAWESLEPFAWFDPQVLQEAESRARPVHVSELSSLNVDVKTQPAK